MIVVIPAAEAISAATTFERMPPEPSGETECPMSRAANISVSVTSVEEREQHLGGLDAALAQQLVVGAVQPPLSHGAGRLQLLDRARAHRQVEHVDPARDRARGDHHHLHARAVQGRDFLADARDHGQAQLARVLGDDGRAQLDDGDRHGAAQPRRAGARSASALR
jgi:hypothetical protein